MSEVSEKDKVVFLARVLVSIVLFIHTAVASVGVYAAMAAHVSFVQVLSAALAVRMFLRPTTTTWLDIILSVAAALVCVWMTA